MGDEIVSGRVEREGKAVERPDVIAGSMRALLGRGAPEGGKLGQSSGPGATSGERGCQEVAAVTGEEATQDVGSIAKGESTGAVDPTGADMPDRRGRACRGMGRGRSCCEQIRRRWWQVRNGRSK